MRKEVVLTKIKCSGCMSLQNDLPFSMSSESDKEVLLFPLYSEDKDSRPEGDIYRMIDEFIQSETNQKVVKIETEVQASKVVKAPQLTPLSIDQIINASIRYQ